MNRELLKEAIADAKAVKETAIANAKAALEEQFTPFLKEKLAAKIAEMDEMEEEVELEEAEEVNEENFNMDEAYEVEEAEEVEEGDEMDLDELLRELDEMSEVEEDITEGEEDLINNPEGSTAHGNVAEEEEMEMDEEEINLEDMSEDDLKSFIESVIADMVAAGELEGNMESDMEDEEEFEASEDEEEVNIDELLAELEERKKYGGNKGDIPSSKRGKIKKDTAEDEGVEDYKKKIKEMKQELDEAYLTINTIQSEINEVNLLNAKLLYTNKIFKAKNLTESQKVKILESFDKATTTKEAKLIYETLINDVKEKKISVNESLFKSSASKPVGTVSQKKPIIEVNEQFARWQVLAGIKK